MPLTTSCDPIYQTGCATGQSCYLGAADPACYTTGFTAVGGTCTGATANECVRGASCIYDGSTYHCYKLCDPNSPSCLGTDSCVPLTDATVGACVPYTPPNCDPTVTSSCSSGQGCYWDGTTYSCFAAGAGGNGASCTAGTGCKAGYDCFNPGVCKQYCGLDGSPVCTNAATCTDMGDTSGLNLGYCP